MPSQRLTHLSYSGDKVADLLAGQRSMHIAKPTIGGEEQLVGGHVVETDSYPLGNIVGRFAVVRADVDDPRAELTVWSPLHPLVDLRHLPCAVFEDELVGSGLEQIRE